MIEICICYLASLPRALLKNLKLKYRVSVISFKATQLNAIKVAFVTARRTPHATGFSPVMSSRADIMF